MNEVLHSISLILPLLAIAGSAVAWVVREYRESARRRHERLFELMAMMDEKGSIATKLAAVYQMRHFPEHKDFVVRFCQEAEHIVTGEASEALVKELRQTRESFDAG